MIMCSAFNASTAAVSDGGNFDGSSVKSTNPAASYVTSSPVDCPSADLEASAGAAGAAGRPSALARVKAGSTPAVVPGAGTSGA